ncbi:hypothetical protein JW859_14515 [bacterium]|nr:hypothetical protein [bacterium]
MRRTEPLRLFLLGLLLLFFQQAWYFSFPGSRAPVDLYVLFVLLTTAAAGPVMGGVMALTGGMLMDLYGAGYGAFHCFFYLLPVLIGAQLRAHMLTEFRLLGALATVALIILKILSQYLYLVFTGRGGSPLMLFQLNYWPLVFIALGVYFSWRWLVRQFPLPSKVRADGY